MRVGSRIFLGLTAIAAAAVLVNLAIPRSCHTTRLDSGKVEVCQTHTWWLFVIIAWLITAALYLFYRRASSRPCPRCGRRVAVGELRCQRCDFDFATIGASGAHPERLVPDRRE